MSLLVQLSHLPVSMIVEEKTYDFRGTSFKQSFGVVYRNHLVYLSVYLSVQMSCKHNSSSTDIQRLIVGVYEEG